MNAPISLRAALWLALGTAAILLLGAFTHIETASSRTVSPFAAVVPSAAPAPEITFTELESDPAPPANLSPKLAELIKLAQGHVDENVMLAFVQSSSQTYSPTADEILYLKALGVSQNVIAAMLVHRQSPPTELAVKTPEVKPIAAVAPVATAPTPAVVEKAMDPAASFYSALAPYGKWINSADYGVCWQPQVAVEHHDWRPYLNRGQWLFSDNGWYWQSLYAWGWLPFHYGRWTKLHSYGWVWVPDNTWGPAWVAWRQTPGYLGWAPLPPGAALTANGFTFHNRTVPSAFDFNLTPGWYTFVSQTDFMNPNLLAYSIPPAQSHHLFEGSAMANHYSIANNQVINKGPSPGVIHTKSNQPPAFRRYDEGRREFNRPSENMAGQLASAPMPETYRQPFFVPGPTASAVAARLNQPIQRATYQSPAVISAGPGAAKSSR